jgi:hypothetical protein
MDYPEEQSQEEYTDQEEWQDNFLDEQREAWDENYGNYPQHKKPDSLFSLFKRVWNTQDSTKVANLNKTELGDLGISVRDCQRIALLSNVLHHSKFATYFLDQAETTLSTSMSKDGWFVELFVTSKKFAHKGNINNLQQKPKQKWRIFGNKEQKTDEE